MNEPHNPADQEQGLQASELQNTSLVPQQVDQSAGEASVASIQRNPPLLEDPSTWPGRPVNEQDRKDITINLTALRETCMGLMKYEEKVFDTGVPAQVLALQLFDACLCDIGFDWAECEGRIEFWQSPDPEAPEQHTSVCSVFLEQSENQLKLTFGSLGFAAQTLKAAVLARKESLVNAAGGTLLLGPTAGISLGLMNTAIGAGFGVVNMLNQRLVWSKATAILQILDRKHPRRAVSKSGGSGSFLDRLEQLVRLRDAGALQPDEFEKLKAELMASNSEPPTNEAAPEAPAFSQEMKIIRLCIPMGSKVDPASAQGQSDSSGGTGCVILPFLFLLNCSVVAFLGVALFGWPW